MRTRARDFFKADLNQVWYAIEVQHSKTKVWYPVGFHNKVHFFLSQEGQTIHRKVLSKEPFDEKELVQFGRVSLYQSIPSTLNPVIEI